MRPEVLQLIATLQSPRGIAGMAVCALIVTLGFAWFLMHLAGPNVEPKTLIGQSLPRLESEYGEARPVISRRELKEGWRYSIRTGMNPVGFFPSYFELWLKVDRNQIVTDAKSIVTD